MSEALQVIKFDPRQAALIGARMARGLTMEQACVLHEPPIDPADFKTALESDWQVQIAFKRAQAAYIEGRLADIEGGDMCQGSQWILSRVHRQQFSDGPTTVNNNLTINGFTPEAAAQIRKRAKMKSIVEAQEIIKKSDSI